MELLDKALGGTLPDQLDTHELSRLCVASPRGCDPKEAESARQFLEGLIQGGQLACAGSREVDVPPVPTGNNYLDELAAARDNLKTLSVVSAEALARVRHLLEARGSWSAGVNAWLRHHTQQKKEGRGPMTKEKIGELPEFAGKVFRTPTGTTMKAATLLNEWPDDIKGRLEEIKGPGGRRFNPDVLLRVMGELGYTIEDKSHEEHSGNPDNGRDLATCWTKK